MKKILSISIVMIIACLALFFYSKYPISVSQDKQLIFIGIDGVHVDEFQKLLSEDKLPNFKKVIDNGGFNGEANIVGHDITETAPGNAELHSGLPSKSIGILRNTCGVILPKDASTFERLKQYASGINLGLIYGKETCYIPTTLLEHAKESIVWWQDRTTYKQRDYINNKCSNALDVAQKSLEFLSIYKDKPFYLFVYFGNPDCAGHEFGVPSDKYREALQHTDEALGIILKNIESNSMNPKIIISSDHGWNLNTKGHSNAAADSRRIILLTNDSKLITTTETKKQCDIAPTILKYFGVDEDVYKDSVDAGCKPLN